MKTKKQFGGTYKAEYAVAAAAVLSAAISAASTFETNLTSSNTNATGNFATELGSLDSGVTTTSGGETGGETGGTLCHATFGNGGTGFIALSSGTGSTSGACTPAEMEASIAAFSILGINHPSNSINLATGYNDCTATKNFIYIAPLEGNVAQLTYEDYYYTDGSTSSTSIKMSRTYMGLEIVTLFWTVDQSVNLNFGDYGSCYHW